MKRLLRTPVVAVSLGLTGLLTILPPTGASESEPMKAPLSTASLSLSGNGMTHDSFSLAVAAAARLLGRDADEETIYALSTNAFAPTVNEGEDCSAWWHVESWSEDRAMETVAGSLRLDARRLDFPKPPGEKDGDDAWRGYRLRVARILRRAMDGGAAVVALGVWKFNPPHGFVPWGWAGVVVEANPDDGTVLGACLNGRKDNPLDRPGRAWALTPSGRSLPSEDADRATLRRAVERIRAQGPFAKDGKVVHGLEAMDAWIGRMTAIPGFCAPCESKEKRGWSCAADNGARMAEAARVAASWLRNRAGSFPGKARPRLEAAAARYDRIALLLRPSVSGGEKAGYVSFVGDVEAQKRHAREVLTPIREALASAAGYMEAALRASRPRVSRLTGVPGSRGDGHAFARGLEILLAQAGTPVDYDTLMGDLGLAFMLPASDRVPRYNGALDVGWWPLDSNVLEPFLDFTGRAAGRRIDFYRDAEETPAAPAETAYRRRYRWIVEDTIASNRPVLANYDFWRVVTTLDNGKPPLLGFCPRSEPVTPERLGAYPTVFAVAGEGLPRLDRREADRIALEHAARLWDDAVPMKWGFVTGKKAYELWKATLADTKHPGPHYYHSNVVLHLGWSRRAAAAYLRSMAKRWPDSVAVHLRQAARAYDSYLAALRTADTSADALDRSDEGRRRLSDLAERLSWIDGTAIHEIWGAIVDMDADGIDSVAGQVRPAALAEIASRDFVGDGAPYLGAGVPNAIVAALNRAGTSIDFDGFAAGTGWAFSFGYDYKNWHIASLAVCGRPDQDGPFEVFRWLPEQLGYGFEGVPASDETRFRAFVRENVDAGWPILSEHIDGGLIGGYRENGGRFEVWFDGTVGAGWTPQNDLQGWVYTLSPRRGSPGAAARLYRKGLERAVGKALPHEFDGVPQGLAALEAYRNDVADPKKTFDGDTTWFCWAAFERLAARRSCARWLERAANALGGAREPLLDAARHYARAAEGYQRYRAAPYAPEEEGGTPAERLRSITERLRSPERIAVMVPFLDAAIAEERAGIDAMRQALAALRSRETGP